MVLAYLTKITCTNCMVDYVNIRWMSGLDGSTDPPPQHHNTQLEMRVSLEVRGWYNHDISQLALCVVIQVLTTLRGVSGFEMLEQG